MARCLRCKAGPEWIEGDVKPEPSPEYVPLLASVEKRRMQGCCIDCGRKYGDEYGFPDLVIHDEAWKSISPTGHDGGLLCPSCMCRRAHDAGIKCEARFTSGPFVSSHAASDVLAERRRQVEVEGWDAEHDDLHDTGGLANAAACYAATAEIFWKASVVDGSGEPVRGGYAGADIRQEKVWPWEPRWWKPKDRRRDLVRAAALIIAEIERLDRAQPKDSGGEG